VNGGLDAGFLFDPGPRTRATALAEEGRAAMTIVEAPPDTLPVAA
jgi:hypothetical protein